MTDKDLVLKAMSQVISAQANLINALQATDIVAGSDNIVSDKSDDKDNTQTFGTYCFDFLDRHKPQIRRTTYDTYSWNLQKKIIPYIGDYHMDEINSDLVQEYVNERIKDGMSVHSARDNVGIIKLILKDFAKHNGRAAPVTDIKYPKQKKADLSEKVLNSKDYETLYQYGTNSANKVGVAALLGLTLGMRIGEVCGLKLSDVDFDKRQIHIRRSVKRVKTATGSELEISDPKTMSSIRDLPMTEDIADAILSLDLTSDDYIASGRASPTEPRTLRQAYARLLKRLNIADHTFHDLRHTFASRSIVNGADVRTVADLMGHTTIEMTLNTYTHSNDDAKRKVVVDNLCKENQIMNG